MIPNSQPVQHSPTWTFFEGRWHRGNVPMVGPRTHGFWLGSTVFDGARAFNGVTPDLDRHCARVNRSAISFGLKPVVDLDTWLGLAREGIARFAPGAELYVRPMYWPQSGVGGGVIFDPETTEWCMCIYEAPLPHPVGVSITLSPFRRPTAECAPVEAKAACLYPNNSRALMEAASRGFQNCLMLDMLGNVAEFGNSNVFMAKDGVVYTPTPNGTFLNGITRFPAGAELYIRPMYWPQNGVGGGVLYDPETTEWCLCIYEAPLPQPVGISITLSPFRRPTAECAPVEAKAACLYPNNSRALIEAASRGFQNCLMLDMLGNVAEFGNSNVFMGKDGVVYTPTPNGTFLNGITRRRVIELLRGTGVTVMETTLRYSDFLDADEIFSTGNFAKVMPVIRIDDRQLTPGPFYARARKLYWDFAHAVKMAA